MKHLLCVIVTLISLSTVTLAEGPKFEPVANWLKVPADQDYIGDSHGDVAVASNGDVFVSVTKGPRGGIQVYDKDGNYLRNLPNTPGDLHGFVLHQEGDEEYLYVARLWGGTVQKMKLDGTIVMEIPRDAFPKELRLKLDDGRELFLLTSVDVAPDGRIFVVDGYASDMIHVFSPEGKYLDSFGGKEEPYNFRTAHKLCVDTRFDPPRLLVCSREAREMVHLTLDGELIGERIPNMMRPAAVVIHGDYAVVAEIEGRISLLDKDGKTVTTFGENPIKEQTATNKVKPEDWKPGVLTAPHGLDFDSDGNLFVTEYSEYGRVLRYDRADQ